MVQIRDYNVLVHSCFVWVQDDLIRLLDKSVYNTVLRVMGYKQLYNFTKYLFLILDKANTGHVFIILYDIMEDVLFIFVSIQEKPLYNKYFTVYLILSFKICILFWIEICRFCKVWSSAWGSEWRLTFFRSFRIMLDVQILLM